MSQPLPPPPPPRSTPPGSPSPGSPPPRSTPSPSTRPSNASKSWADWLIFLDLSKISTLVLGCSSLILAGVIGSQLLSRLRTYDLRLGAGSANGESYVLGQAIAAVTERYYPRIQITVQQTGGTSENLKLLEAGDIDLATAQADVPVGPSARILANLYADKFQLAVYRNAKIQRFADLRGLRIALPQSGGQYQSFLSVAEHFGLDATSFIFVGGTEEEADQFFLDRQADAAFRVRAPSNAQMQRLAKIPDTNLLPIDQAAAMQIKHPAFTPAVIPQGTYSGNPAIPGQDLPTVAVFRTLLLDEEIPRSVAAAITEVLMDRRQEIIDAIPGDRAEVRPLVAEFQRPDTTTGLGAPLHPGALAYYDRNKPSFIQENADALGLGVTLLLLLGSWMVQLRGLVEAYRKNQADAYSGRVIELLEQAQQSQSFKELERIREQLLAILPKAVRDLDKDVISEESFQSFRVVWQIALDVTRERRSILIQKRQQP
ncbi:MAG: TAXI family TRAP transporter solute-binding subunit [Prochlorothrix sp.]|nr:TAXI family TRAP transporter solute-binding subunit [Prochlorothrix sp.]